ncbi:MAG: polysaccharide biosynthesis C-terminal domain-containing protein, partial [Clostridia bacterium]|nr:polysaccharide biosynthesis C-terminal domain-containing protein [Clostridia bacterium]
ELLSFLINLFFVWMDQRKKGSRKRVAACDGNALLRITAPIAFASYIRSALLTLQNVLIPRGLRQNGASHATSLAAYGCIHSMALPIVLYPAALISSFSGLLIPTLAECQVQKRQRQIRYIVARVWFFSMLFSVGAAGILICFSEEFGILLYPGTDTGKYIRLLAPLIPIMYLDTATDAMLKGLGEQVYSMKINILDALLSVILVWTLIPSYGIDGYIVAIYVSEVFNTVFSITKLLCVTKISVKLLKWVYQPLLCILAATYTSRFLLSYHRTGTTVGTGSSIFHCCLAALLYLVFLLLTGTINREELAWGKTLICQRKDTMVRNSKE